MPPMFRGPPRCFCRFCVTGSQEMGCVVKIRIQFAALMFWPLWIRGFFQSPFRMLSRLVDLFSQGCLTTTHRPFALVAPTRCQHASLTGLVSQVSLVFQAVLACHSCHPSLASRICISHGCRIGWDQTAKRFYYSFGILLQTNDPQLVQDSHCLSSTTTKICCQPFVENTPEIQHEYPT